MNTLAKVNLLVDAKHVHGKALSNAYCSIRNQSFVLSIVFGAANGLISFLLVIVANDGGVKVCVDVHDLCSLVIGSCSDMFAIR